MGNAIAALGLGCGRRGRRVDAMAVLVGIRTRDCDEPSKEAIAVGMVVELPGPETLIGRGPDRVAVRLPDGKVSKLHARVLRSGERYEIEDLNSRNGTYLNRRRLAAWHPTRLSDGDEVLIPPFCFVFREHPEEE
jgi:pSer/pThr/pTyr-binding forkhead associated (FHA) protein